MRKLLRAAICSVLALCIICGMFSVTATAAVSGGAVSRNPLYDDDSFWSGYDPDSDPDEIGSYSICFIADKSVMGDFSKMYCYIYDLTPHNEEDISYEPIDGNGHSFSSWGSNYCAMEPSGRQAAVSVDSYTTTGEVWYLDLYDRDIRLNPDDTYLCIFTSDWQSQTCDLIVGTPCMGLAHTAFLDGNLVENPADSQKHSLTASWSNVDTKLYAQPLTITSLGNVTGTAYAKGQTPYSKFLSFISSTGKDGLRNALIYNNKTSQQTIDDIATNPAIDLTKGEIQKAIDEANAIIREKDPDAEPISWLASLSPARDDSTVPDGYLYPVPEISNIESTANGVKLSWDRTNGAYSYRVFYRNKKGGWTAKETTVSDNYTDTDVRDGGTYVYTIRCVDIDGKYVSDYNNDGWEFTYAKPVPAIPQITKIENTADGVKLSWNASDSADMYRVFYKNRNNKWIKLGDTADTTLTDTVVSDGVIYTYTLRCLDSKGDYTTSYYSNGWNHTYRKVILDAPVITSLSSTSQGVNLNWDKVDGASAYRVFYKNRSGGWTKLGDTANTSFVDNVVSYGTTYTYTVRCLNSTGKYCSSYDDAGWSHTYSYILPTPKISSLSCSAEGVTVSWDAVMGATHYRVFYKNKKGGWTKLGDTSNCSILDNIVTEGTSYTYTVRCLNAEGRYCSSYDAKGSSVTYASGVATPKVTKLESTSKGVKLTWRKLAGVTSYRVFYKNRNGGWTKLGDTSIVAFTDTDVRVGGTYTYTVRALNSSGRYCSGYNATGFTYTYNP